MRLHTWQLNLEEFCATRQRMPFQWGVNDCALFASDCVLALTGKDFAKPWRGYNTELGANELLQKHGGLEGLATKSLGKPCAVQEIVVGDVVLLAQYNAPSRLGIFTGAACIGPGKRGIIVVTLEHAVAAWSV